MNHDYNGVIMDNEILIDMSPQHVGNVFGHYDKNVKLIEKVLNVDIVQRGDGIKITGKKDATLEAEKILNELLKMIFMLMEVILVVVMENGVIYVKNIFVILDIIIIDILKNVN
jgi:phosphate starvation-inducible protein PhoH